MSSDYVNFVSRGDDVVETWFLPREHEAERILRRLAPDLHRALCEIQSARLERYEWTILIPGAGLSEKTRADMDGGLFRGLRVRVVDVPEPMIARTLKVTDL